MTPFPWHRVFHPLSGADPLTLARLTAARGLPGARGALPYAVAWAVSLLRLPLTLAEAALPPGPVPAPVFIVGFPRSGTTHLHNLVAASGAFATAPPVRATFPWEPRTAAPVMKRVVDPFLPRTRLIDGVAMGPDAPTEDEVGLANLAPGSYFHALYFPSRLAHDYREGLTAPWDARRRGAVLRYARALSLGDPRPLLLKNPAYTARVATLLGLFPDARIVHIHRDPHAVFASARRALARTLHELALQPWDAREAERAVLEAYPLVMRRLREEARALPPGRFAEVSFEEVAADPRGALRRLWARLDLPAPTAGGVDAYLASVTGFRPEGAQLTALERARVSRLWGEEVARYGAGPDPIATAAE